MARRRSEQLHPRWVKTIILFTIWPMLLASENLGAAPARSRHVHRITGTLEVAPGYPRVHVQLRQGRRTLTGQPLDGHLQQLLGASGAKVPNEPDRSFVAYLDTGSSGHVISKSTAARFGIEAVAGAVYHDFGLHGETPLSVSRRYRVALCGSRGTLDDEPRNFRSVHPAAAMLLNRAAADPLVTLAMGQINVIGMPAIRRLVVEIDPTPMLAGSGFDLDAVLEGQTLDLLQQVGALVAGPAVRLHRPSLRAGPVDFDISLDFTQFHRTKHPRDRGPLPELAANPTIRNVETVMDGKGYRADWLLDTAAPASIISTTHASALGLYDAQGHRLREPDFVLPLGGIGGDIRPSPGFRLKRLRIPAAHGKTLEFQGAFVVVHDVQAKLDSGEEITLDGVLGMNLLLPSVSGLTMGLPTQRYDGAFERIWIDGPRRRLMLELR